MDKKILKAFQKAGFTDIKPYDPNNRPEIYRRFQEMATREGLDDLELFTTKHKEPNAITLPFHKKVIITESILSLLDDREMAAIIAHEMGHCLHPHKHAIYRREFLKRIGAVVGMNIGIGLDQFIGKDKAATAKPEKEKTSVDEILESEFSTPILAGVVGFSAGSVIGVPLSQSAEREADREAVRICGDKEALISALEKLKAWAKREGSSFNSLSHGSMEKRVVDIKNAERGR